MSAAAFFIELITPMNSPRAHCQILASPWLIIVHLKWNIFFVPGLVYLLVIIQALLFLSPYLFDPEDFQ
jgi:hypothetical protein